MPELPDLTIYLEALEKRILHQRLLDIRVSNPFFLRTVVPAVDSAKNREVISLRRIGKRIAIGLKDDLWLVLHLMIAGRLHWIEAGGSGKSPRSTLATFQFVARPPSHLAGRSAIPWLNPHVQERTVSHEERNVDQCLAAGGVPDRDH